MSKEGRKPRTPLITVEVPHPDDKVREMIGAELVEQWFNDNLEFDTTAGEVTIIARDPNTGRITLKETYVAESWEAIQDFLDDIRHRLIESIGDELLEYVQMHLEDKFLPERVAHPDIEAVTPPEAARMFSKTDLVESWVRDTLGLEGRARPIISVSNIARIRLRGGDDDARKHMVREARALMKEWKS